MTSAPLPVYVIHWNAPEWCADTVASLGTSNTPVAVTVIDNGGASLTLEDGVRVLRQPRNLGYTGGANAALRDWLESDEPVAVITSHDLSVDPSTLARLLAALDQDSSLGICGPVYHGVGSSGGPLLGNGPGVEWREWISGTCLMIRRECAVDVGWFDETFGSYVEDVDFCYRARRAGWRVATVLDSSASGRGSGSGSLNATKQIHANAILLGYKEHGLHGTLQPAWTAVRLALASVRHQRFAQSRACMSAVGSGYRRCFASRRNAGDATARPERGG